MLRQRDSAEDLARIDNLNELVNAMAEGAERGETLADFLDRAALVSDADNFDERATVTLLTSAHGQGPRIRPRLPDRPRRRHLPAQPFP